MTIQIEHTKDFRELARLNQSVQKWHHENYPDIFKPFNFNEVTTEMKKLVADEHFFCLLAKNENVSVGYLIGFIRSRHESAFQYAKTILYIDQIAVLNQYQKCGIGQLMMNEVYRIAKQHNLTEIQLDYWFGNQKAEQFFTKNGFSCFNSRMKMQLLTKE